MSQGLTSREGAAQGCSGSIARRPRCPDLARASHEKRRREGGARVRAQLAMKRGLQGEKRTNGTKRMSHQIKVLISFFLVVGDHNRVDSLSHCTYNSIDFGVI